MSGENLDEKWICRGKRFLVNTALGRMKRKHMFVYKYIYIFIVEENKIVNSDYTGHMGFRELGLETFYIYSF